MAEKARLTVPNRVELGESVTLEIEVNSDVTLPEIGDTVEYAVTFKTLRAKRQLSQMRGPATLQQTH